MRVRAIKDFYDLERKISVKAGDEFEVTAARGKALTSKANKAAMAVCEELSTPTTEEKVVKKARAKKEA